MTTGRHRLSRWVAAATISGLFATLAPVTATAQQQGNSTTKASTVDDNDVTTLGQRVANKLSELPPATRIGMVIARDDGVDVFTLNPNMRFVPASNTKIVTTIAAFARLPDLDQPDRDGGAEIYLVPQTKHQPPIVVLRGRGDARLSSAADCTNNCLGALADAVAAKTRTVSDIQIDDSSFATEPFSAGMSWNNAGAWYGTATSAIVIDDNELRWTVTPATQTGMVAALSAPRTMLPVTMTAITVPGKANDLTYRWNGRFGADAAATIGGTIGIETGPVIMRIGVLDAKAHAAALLRSALEQRGVSIRQGANAATVAPVVVQPNQLLAKLTPPPLIDDLRRINKESQNLHAEMLLRRIGAQHGDASVAGGLRVAQSVLDDAGVKPVAAELFDGSGMSSYNRLSPRGMVQLLTLANRQQWGSAFRDTLPIGGIDGTLRQRFVGTPLAGNIRAKTGTLYAANALAGYVTAASGQRLIFAIYANDMAGDADATPVMDAIIAMVAAAH